MTEEERNCAVRSRLLLKLANLGPRSYAKLEIACQGDWSALERQPRQLATKAYLSTKQIAHIVEAASGLDEKIAALNKQFQALHVSCVLPEDDGYPPLLLEITDRPFMLFVQGTLLPPQHPLAVVGSRKPSHYGQAVLSGLLGPVIEAGAEIISGLAYGIDKLAHETALKWGGRTIAVLGSGLGSIYPRTHEPLAKSIIERGGAVISEFLPSVGPRKEYFPLRNRIVAGLSQAVFVVEAGQTSGALITARLALSENRDVAALPGDISRKEATGPNRLIRDGATPITSPADLLELLNLTSVQQVPMAQLPPALQWLSEHPGSLAEEVAAGIAGLLPTCVETLVLAEISGQVTRASDGRYQMQ